MGTRWSGSAGRCRLLDRRSPAVGRACRGRTCRPGQPEEIRDRVASPPEKKRSKAQEEDKESEPPTGSVARQRLRIFRGATPRGRTRCRRRVGVPRRTLFPGQILTETLPAGAVRNVRWICAVWAPGGPWFKVTHGFICSFGLGMGL